MTKDNDVKIEIDSESSRIRSVFVNSGRYNFAEAEEKLAVSTLCLMMGDDAASTPAGQAAFLTAAIAGTRCFGQVAISGTLDASLLFPLPIPAKTLAEAAVYFGAQRTNGLASTRKVLFGSTLAAEDGWAVRAVWNGWISGSRPWTAQSSLAVVTVH